MSEYPQEPSGTAAPTGGRVRGVIVWCGLAALLGLLAGIHGAIWSGQAWHWFPEGARLLFSGSGLHLYALHPDLQIGPLSFVAVAPLIFALPARAAEVTAMVIMSGAGLVVLAALRNLLPAPWRRYDARFALAAACFVATWAELAVTFAHVDDVLAIGFTVAALHAVRSGRVYLAAALLAVAADCKPWAAAFVVLLLLADSGRLRALAVWAGGVLVVWLPFVLADTATLSAARYRIPNNAASSLRTLGVHSWGTPGWDRPAQLLLAVTLGTLVIARGRWSAVLVVVIAARLLLDPAVWSYYDAGLLTGTVLCDLVLIAGPIPLLSLSAVSVLYLPMFFLHAHPGVYGAVRSAYLLTLIVALVALPDRVLRRPRIVSAAPARAPSSQIMPVAS